MLIDVGILHISFSVALGTKWTPDPNEEIGHSEAFFVIMMQKTNVSF